MVYNSVPGLDDRRQWRWPDCVGEPQLARLLTLLRPCFVCGTLGLGRRKNGRIGRRKNGRIGFAVDRGDARQLELIMPGLERR